MIHRHHRKLRSQGGTDEPVNLLDVTLNLHDWIHRNPAISYARGWLVKSWQDPAEVAVSPHPELQLVREEAA